MRAENKNVIDAEIELVKFLKQWKIKHILTNTEAIGLIEINKEIIFEIIK